MRDLDLAEKLGKLSDETLVGSAELAALTGFSIISIRQRKLPLPPNDPRFTHMRWTLGTIKAWLKGDIPSVPAGQGAKRRR